MCGLVGVAGLIDLKAVTIFKTLLDLDVVRGAHSTGVFTVDRGGDREVNIYKELGTPNYLYDANPDVVKDRKFTPNKYCVLAGHNRYATQGGITRSTAHPFRFNDIVGMHNGTVKQGSLKDFHNSSEFKVDSQKIFSEIAKNRDVKKVWEKADGAMALVWWDAKHKTLEIARNKERTLYFYSDQRTIYWASESWMLEMAFSRANKSYKSDEICMVKADTHFTISIPDFPTTAKPIEVVSDPLPEFVPKPVVVRYNFNTQVKGSNVTRMLKNPFTCGVVSENRWKELTGGQCASCLESMDFSDCDEFSWLNKSEVCCSQCASFAQYFGGYSKGVC